jgi:hypothetical protein
VNLSAAGSFRVHDTLVAEAAFTGALTSTFFPDGFTLSALTDSAFFWGGFFEGAFPFLAPGGFRDSPGTFSGQQCD